MATEFTGDDDRDRLEICEDGRCIVEDPTELWYCADCTTILCKYE
jgi:hypothetical protein